MLNPNLTNPTIVIRVNEERERDLHRAFIELREDVSKFEQPNAPNDRTQVRHNYAVFAWLHAFMMR